MRGPANVNSSPKNVTIVVGGQGGLQDGSQNVKRQATVAIDLGMLCKALSHVYDHTLALRSLTHQKSGCLQHSSKTSSDCHIESA